MHVCPFAVACAFLAGCGTSTTSGTDAAADAPGPDANTADAGNDAALDAGGDAACGTTCRLFADYCNTQPCVCLSLPSTQPDPTCDAGTVSCLVDPCQGKAAVCTSGGCTVQ